jgi:hypothetical protein
MGASIRKILLLKDRMNMKMVASRGYLQLYILIGSELEKGAVSDFFFGRNEVFILFAEEPHMDLTAC